MNLLLPTSLLSLKLLTDLSYLSLNLSMILGNAITLCKGRACSINSTTTIVPTRRFAQEEHARDHNDGPNEGDAHWQSPCSVALILFGPKIDAVRNEDSKSDEELVA